MSTNYSFSSTTMVMDEQTTQFPGNLSDLATTTQSSLVQQASQTLMYKIGVTSLKYWLPITFPFGAIGKCYIL